MKQLIFSIIAVLGLFACSHSHSHDDHAHAEEAETGPEPLVYTLYTEKTELFVEFKPLIKGQESSFAAHFTSLGHSFKAIGEGSVTLTLSGPEGRQSITAEQPSVPGIFRLGLIPEHTGLFKLIFDIKTPDYTDRITIENIGVYPDEKSAMADQSEEGTPEAPITYLKEQAWKVDFANQEVRRQPFYQVVRTSGMASSAPGDEQTVTATTPGIVSLGRNRLFAGTPVTAGQTLFSISSKNFTGDNADVRLEEARNNLEKAKADFDRNQKLIGEQLITQKEFLESRQEMDNAQALYNSLSQNYSQSGQPIKAPLTGYVKALLVAEGQYAEAGQPLAVLSKNNRLVVKAELSQTAFAQINRITSANFRVNSRQVYSLQELNGRVASIGKSAENDLFIPVYFEIDNREGILPGAYMEVFIQTGALADALVIPLAALMEEQGNFYCYVQTGGESFEKRELKLGGNDGRLVQVHSGISKGERVVTKGAYNIKLSTASGALPSHGHSH